MHTVCIRVVFNPKKAKQNLAKHGVHLSEAELVLSDPHAITIEDTTAEGEHRYITLGADALGRILVVVFTHRGDDVRLISARRATRQERKAYEEGI